MRFEFIGRNEGLAATSKSDRSVIDVSSYSPTHSQLSPYTWSKDIALAVPGLDDEIAHSVEGVWQGLKVVNGEIDRKLFRMRPRKRRGPVEGHLLGDQLVDIVEARKQIYYPVYFEYLDNYVDPAVFEEFLDRMVRGNQVLFFDTESNGDIRVNRPLAHAAVLATYMNLLLWQRIPEALRRPPSGDPFKDSAQLADWYEPPLDDGK